MTVPVMEHIIRTYRLIPHPEGGFYREIFRSALPVSSDRVSAERAAVTHIYYLLPQGQVSRFHRVAHDEIWHVYDGDPLRLIRFDGNDAGEICIGPGCPDYVAVVPAGVWQAAEPAGAYTLAGCTVAPGFDFADFSFLSDHPDDRNRLLALNTPYGHLV